VDDPKFHFSEIFVDLSTVYTIGVQVRALRINILRGDNFLRGTEFSEEIAI